MRRIFKPLADVSGHEFGRREAVAVGQFLINPGAGIDCAAVPDKLSIERAVYAGVAAAKAVPALFASCHPLSLTDVNIQVEIEHHPGYKAAVTVTVVRPFPLLWAVVKLSHPEIGVVCAGAFSSLA